MYLSVVVWSIYNNNYWTSTTGCISHATLRGKNRPVKQRQQKKNDATNNGLISTIHKMRQRRRCTLQPLFMKGLQPEYHPH